MAISLEQNLNFAVIFIFKGVVAPVSSTSVHKDGGMLFTFWSRCGIRTTIFYLYVAFIFPLFSSKRKDEKKNSSN
jgi:hypothetical protein